MTLKKNYDLVYIGSSPISIIDAASQKSNNKKILIIENKPFIGGSWTLINVFGYKSVENAIHYFLPSNKGIKFMKSVLGWNIINTKSKYRVINKKIFNKQIYKYDNPIGRLFSKLTNNDFIGVFNLDFLKNIFNKSFYLKDGSKEIMKFCNKVIQEDKIDILYNYNVDKIFINSSNSNVEIKIRNLADKSTATQSINSKKVNLTHGLKIDQIHGDKGNIRFDHLNELRPHIHLLINDNKKKYDELIFDNNKFIKYIHEVSNYLDQEIRNDNKIYILALKPEVSNNKENIKKILNEMIKYEVISQNYEYIDHVWTNIYLPQLIDDDLFKIKKKYSNQVEVMLTENFSKAIELYQSRWYERFKK